MVERSVAVHWFGTLRGGGGVRGRQVVGYGTVGFDCGRYGWERSWFLRLHSHGKQVDGSAVEIEKTVKSLNTMLPLTLALGGVVAIFVLVVPMEAPVRTSALLGALVSSVLGGVVMALKSLLTRGNRQSDFSPRTLTGEVDVGPTGTAALKAVMAAQVLAFMLRLIAVGVGAVAVKQAEALSPMAFVIAFFAVSVAQQMLETRNLLAGTVKVKSSEVKS